MNKLKILRVILIILIILWTCLIFLFSSQDGGESSGFSRKFVEFFIKDPEYYKKDIKFLSCNMFLELRNFDTELNCICIEIENVLNEYLNNNQRAA